MLNLLKERSKVGVAIKKRKKFQALQYGKKHKSEGPNPFQQVLK